MHNCEPILATHTCTDRPRGFRLTLDEPRIVPHLYLSHRPCKPELYIGPNAMVPVVTGLCVNPSSTYNPNYDHGTALSLARTVLIPEL